MSNALEVMLLTEHSQCKSSQANRLYALVRVEALGRPDSKRAPLDLVACIDVSGSMAGGKLAAVKRALHSLASELGATDRLGITSFSTSVRQELPPTAMDAQGKAKLHGVVDSLSDAQSTNMSGGLAGALSDLRSAPTSATGAVRRVLLFTDGHANHGVPENDRAGWAALLRECVGDLSVSWFGFGEDHDADFLSWLADQSKGNASVAKDEDAIADAFAKELGGLLGARASNIELELSVPGAALSLLNDEKSEGRGERVTITLDDLSCDERRDLVVAMALPVVGPEAPPLELRLCARWRDTLSGTIQSAQTQAVITLTATGPDAPRVEVQEAVALVLAANAQKEARAYAENGRWEDAARVIRVAVQVLEAVGTERVHHLAQHVRSLLPEYSDAAQYGRSRSKLKSSERAMSKQRSTGSQVDGFFETKGQREQQEKFKPDSTAGGRAPRRGPPH